MISIIKKVHSHRFKFEAQGISDLLIYRIAMKIAWLAYQVRYLPTLRSARSFIKTARADVLKNNKSAFVFANGPSLSEIDLNKIRALCESNKFDLIAINSYLSKSAAIAKPRFAVFADNVHFNGGDNQYTKDIETCETLGVRYFAPAKYVDDVNSNRIGYCSLCDIDSENTNDITRPAGYYGVTAFFAITLAKMIGYKRIYICGFDNSYFKDFEVRESGEMVISHRHYYDKKEERTAIPCTYNRTSEFFFDTYRHFLFLEKICEKSAAIRNIAKLSYLSSIPRDLSLDVYIED